MVIPSGPLKGNFLFVQSAIQKCSILQTIIFSVCWLLWQEMSYFYFSPWNWSKKGTIRWFLPSAKSRGAELALYLSDPTTHLHPPPHLPTSTPIWESFSPLELRRGIKIENRENLGQCLDLLQGYCRGQEKAVPRAREYCKQSTTYVKHSPTAPPRQYPDTVYPGLHLSQPTRVTTHSSS